jgi:DNA repair photolyase
MSRAEFDNGAEPRPKFLENLHKDAKKYQLEGITEQVMLSFTTDPFNPFDTSLTRPTIETIIKYGMAFCTLTKGGARALPFIGLFRPNRDAFASTLTSLDQDFSLKWERGAALPDERIDTLKKFHERGIFTWVSLEPTLNTESSLQIVRETHGFIDLYKVGRANYLPMTYTTDWEEYTHRMVDLLQKLGNKHYIKHDLQPYLPAGYYNPKYITQHH